MATTPHSRDPRTPTMQISARIKKTNDIVISFNIGAIVIHGKVFIMLDGPFLAPRSGKAKNLVILLHGYGDSGQGLISLGHELAPEMPDTAFVAPNAVEVCEAFAGGYQWFSLRFSDGPLTKEGLGRKELIQKPAVALNEFIDAQLAKWGVDDAHLAIAGFSQGAMMAMYAMPRRPKPCAAVIGYSGMLVDPEGLKAPGISKMPVLVVHGAMDDVVPAHCLNDAETGFKAAGFDVETLLRPHLAHSIDQIGFMRGLDFLKEHLEKAK